ncbi:hypothetical protein GFC29_2664 [Anoxybacillus sp. B7M1]|jgi:hypothetical protein|uniref:Uncharacterized protein n=1 Tax=Anoxybacteroides rupiense TaxID=311460 RepID=A0ABT5W3M2_9BACL|nr:MULTISPECIES: hypothetical protein [Anoxybacillus]ANB56750.1 hypothetical protein GFC28_2770 [Anoxybacillus sp. B2M1]ANB64231.1 hypothetical protein GFC29_2664 [Anoxybacillus sp. B7M1]MBS2771389.1 hypothetical protein [Anoxybacillus rupiensis]MDE8563925.1 hypothetical protein [Anoxybacillus rupiensis]QHC05599.1 hypothetical protein GRQ40_17855 [Anoxybacillus sp. PDR2]
MVDKVNMDFAYTFLHQTGLKTLGRQGTQPSEDANGTRDGHERTTGVRDAG